METEGVLRTQRCDSKAQRCPDSKHEKNDSKETS